MSANLNSLILGNKLLQDDVDQALRSPRQSKNASLAADQQSALEQMKKELENRQRHLRDRDLAVRIERLPRDDAVLISAILEEERASHADRQLALRMGGREEPENQQQFLMHPQMNQVTAMIMAQDKRPVPAKIASNVSQDLEKEEHVQHEKLECVACNEARIYFDMVQTPCSHFYCHGCLFRLFQSSITDDSLFPPRCCGMQISIEGVQTIIGASIWRKLRAKTIEWNDGDKTYCFKPDCSAYIAMEQKQ